MNHLPIPSHLFQFLNQSVVNHLSFSINGCFCTMCWFPLMYLYEIQSHNHVPMLYPPKEPRTYHNAIFWIHTRLFSSQLNRFNQLFLFLFIMRLNSSISHYSCAYFPIIDENLNFSLLLLFSFGKLICPLFFSAIFLP